MIKPMMNGKDTREIVISRKRKRTAVDPCLGFFTRDNKRQTIPDTLKLEYARCKNDDRLLNTSDSLQDLTPPRYSDETSLVTVDEFLNQQGRSPYERKKRSTPIFSSSSSDESECKDKSLYSKKPLTQAATKQRSRTQTLTTCRITMNKNSRNQEFKESANAGFSSRMFKAAILSKVDLDIDLAPRTLPLPLIPFDRHSVSTIPRNKRVRLVDPHTRALESDFVSRKTSLKKQQRLSVPDTCWGKKKSKPIGTAIASRVDSRTSNIQRLRSKPLTIVPYEEHNKTRMVRYGQARNIVSKYDYITKTKLFKRSFGPTMGNTQPYTTRANGNTPKLVVSREKHKSVVYAKPLFLPDPITVLVPATPSISSHSSIESSNKGEKITQSIRTSLDTSRVGKLSVLTALGSTSTHKDVASSEDLVIEEEGLIKLSSCQEAQKSLRGIGSMLGALRETARSVLISQSQ